MPNFVRIDEVLWKIWQTHFGVFFSVHSVEWKMMGSTDHDGHRTVSEKAGQKPPENSRRLKRVY